MVLYIPGGCLGFLPSTVVKGEISLEETDTSFVHEISVTCFHEIFVDFWSSDEKDTVPVV